MGLWVEVCMATTFEIIATTYAFTDFFVIQLS